MGLTIPQADGTLKFTPAVLRDLYAKNGKFKALEANDNESNSSVAPKTVDPVVLPDADATPFFLLSLGTALTEDSISLSDAKKYGMLSWIMGGKIIDLVMNGTSESTHYEMQYVLPDYPDGTKRYVRINPMLWKNHGYIDDTSDDNINRVIDLGNQTVKDNSDLLDKVCERLQE